MNYRHAFHAGNFADCVKHALLVWLVRAMQRKEAGLFILDTHAGIGAYDLTSEAATRTGEWRAGIGRLVDAPPGALADYVGLVKASDSYPGSPALVRALLRPQDRLVCCELHREDVATLRRRFARDRQVEVHHRDGWEALGLARESSWSGIRSSTAPRYDRSRPRCAGCATWSPPSCGCARRWTRRG
jgi:23S rRNA (adenine2030-N6)-methyltransferase